MNPSIMQNIGHFLHVKNGGAVSAAFDSGTYVSGTSVSGTGNVIDRNDEPKWYESCVVAIPFRTDLASGKSMSVTPSLYDCTSSGGTFASHAAGSAKTISNTTTATSVVTDAIARLSVNLRAAKRFLKIKWTHYGASNTATGCTLTVGAPVAIFGGAVETPATAT